jgi:hypothetical protein
MMSRLYLEAPRQEGDALELSARLEDSRRRERIWWRLPAEWGWAVTPQADPYLIAFLFPLMQSSREVMVEGAVSPSLLEHLETYMAAWHAWYPDRYRPVRIHAREEAEAPAAREGSGFVTPFSCGVDSCFTFLRHHRRLAGRRTRCIRAAVTMQGFDVGLDEPNARGVFEGMLARARRMLEGTGVPCIPIANDFRRLATRWGHSHGTQLASTLSLLGGGFAGGLVPNSIMYTHLQVPWGSHPATDAFLGRRGFDIVDDGAEYGRVRKLAALQEWPEALRSVRVCLVNRESDQNCGACEKCALTILACRVAGIAQPASFAAPLTDRQIAALRLHPDLFRESWADLGRLIRERHLESTGWARALRVAQARRERRVLSRRLRAPLSPVRKRLRGLFDRRKPQGAERCMPTPAIPEAVLGE